MKAIKRQKPYMLRRWRIGDPSSRQYFFTCARPGRTGARESKDAPVSDDLVHRWVRGLPGPQTAIVSLLGCKPDGRSEFSFYSFFGGFDRRSENTGRFSFQEWITRWHQDLSIVVCEHPTCDFKPIPADTLNAVASDIGKFISAGRTVVLVDSGGQTRTGTVCKYIKALEDSSQLP
jgi:hypothetical protein